MILGTDDTNDTSDVESSRGWKLAPNIANSRIEYFVWKRKKKEFDSSHSSPRKKGKNAKRRKWVKPYYQSNRISRRFAIL